MSCVSSSSTSASASITSSLLNNNLLNASKISLLNKAASITGRKSPVLKDDLASSEFGEEPEGQHHHNQQNLIIEKDSIINKRKKKTINGSTTLNSADEDSDDNLENDCKNDGLEDDLENSEESNLKNTNESGIEVDMEPEVYEDIQPQVATASGSEEGIFNLNKEISDPKNIDLIVCGRCQTDFKLADLTAFIEHKVNKCSVRSRSRRRKGTRRPIKNSENFEDEINDVENGEWDENEESQNEEEYTGKIFSNHFFKSITYLLSHIKVIVSKPWVITELTYFKIRKKYVFLIL